MMSRAHGPHRLVTPAPFALDTWELADKQTLKADLLSMGLWEWGQEYSQVGFLKN